MFKRFLIPFVAIATFATPAALVATPAGAATACPQGQGVIVWYYPQTSATSWSKTLQSQCVRGYTGFKNQAHPNLVNARIDRVVLNGTNGLILGVYKEWVQVPVLGATFAVPTRTQTSIPILTSRGGFTTLGGRVTHTAALACATRDGRTCMR